MVVSKKAVSDFVEAPRRRLSRYKKKSVAYLNRELKARGATWATEPRKYQKVGLLLGLKFRTLYLDFDPGIGKTKVSLDIFLSRRARGEVARALVLVPGIANVESWLIEVEKHAPGTRAYGVGVSDDRGRSWISEDADVVVMTYARWLSLVGTRVAKKRKTARSRKTVVDRKKLAKLLSGFEMLVADESTQFKNHQSVTFSSLRSVTSYLDYVLCLSGTPMEEPSDLWSQFYVLDRGETLGPTLGLYHSAFFTEHKSYWSPWPEWKFDRRKKADLARLCDHRALSYQSDECLDLPPIVGGLLSGEYLVRAVPWPKGNWAYVAPLVELEARTRNVQEVDNNYLSQRLACSGFLRTEDGEIVPLDANPKLDALVELLDELAGRQVVVYNEYQATGASIEERLRKLRIPTVRIYSGTKDKAGALRKFLAGKARVLVGSRAIAMGLNLQVASDMVIYESPDYGIMREQLERRLLRSGQKRKVRIWDLCMKGSIDLRIINSLWSGKSLLDELRAARRGSP